MIAARIVPLTADRIDEALAMMERFYADVEIEFRRDRARRALEQLPSFGGWWFLEQSGRPVGYFVLTVGYSLEFGGRYALLDEFFVEKQSRGQRLGASAMQRILEQARAMGVAAIHLEADGHVREFYRRSGFSARHREMMTLWLDGEP
jgi:GNAT superfamily N-acetyltransferase